MWVYFINTNFLRLKTGTLVVLLGVLLVLFHSERLRFHYYFKVFDKQQVIHIYFVHQEEQNETKLFLSDTTE
jgi:hypothetical protein